MPKETAGPFFATMCTKGVCVFEFSSIPQVTTHQRLQHDLFFFPSSLYTPQYISPPVPAVSITVHQLPTMEVNSKERCCIQVDKQK